MSRNDTWMPLYLGDYLADTMHLNGAQHGAYLLLLMHYWRNGPLPNDDAQLATIAKTEPKAWRAISQVVRSFFTVSNGRLHQKRMDHERVRWTDISDKRRVAGRAGADAKWGTNGGKPPDKPGGKPIANAKANGGQTPGFCHDSASTPLPLPSPKIDSSLNEAGDARASGAQPEEPVVGPDQTKSVVVSMEKALHIRAYPPGKMPQRTVNEQREAVAPKQLKSVHLSREQINASLRRKA